jgi:hypothetical protein
MARPSSPVPSVNYDEKKDFTGSTEHQEDVAVNEFVAANEKCFENYTEEETKAMEKRFVRKVGPPCWGPELRLEEGDLNLTDHAPFLTRRSTSVSCLFSSCSSSSTFSTEATVCLSPCAAFVWIAD